MHVREVNLDMFEPFKSSLTNLYALIILVDRIAQTVKRMYSGLLNEMYSPTQRRSFHDRLGLSNDSSAYC